MDRFQRGLIARTAALAVACTLALALTGAGELALYLSPLLLLVTLLLSGRYIGEDRILRHWRSGAARPARRSRPRWAHPADLPLASLHARGPVRRRGPPSPAALAV